MNFIKRDAALDISISGGNDSQTVIEESEYTYLLNVLTTVEKKAIYTVVKLKHGVPTELYNIAPCGFPICKCYGGKII